MAATTPTSIAPAINTEAIDALTLGYFRERAFLAPLFRNKSIIGLGSLKHDFNSYGSISVAATTPGTDLTPAELTVGEDGTVTATEKGAAIEPLLLSVEASAGRVDFDSVARELGAAMAEKLQTDIATAFASLTNSTGTSGADMTLADFEDAVHALRLRKVPIGAPPDFVLPPGMAGVFAALAEVQWRDFSRSARQAGVPLGGPMTGMNLDGVANIVMGAQRGSYLGTPIYTTANNTTANASADVVGFIGVPYALGITYGVGPQILMEDHTLGRSKYIVGRWVYGVGVIKDSAGQKIVTDA